MNYPPSETGLGEVAPLTDKSIVLRESFRDWHEQQASNKKEVDPGTPSNQRDRR